MNGKKYDPWDVALGGKENNTLVNRWKFRFFGPTQAQREYVHKLAIEQAGGEDEVERRARAYYERVLADPLCQRVMQEQEERAKEYLRRVESIKSYNDFMRGIEVEERRMAEPPGAERRRKLEKFFTPLPPTGPRAPQPEGTLQELGREKVLS